MTTFSIFILLACTVFLNFSKTANSLSTNPKPYTSIASRRDAIRQSIPIASGFLVSPFLNVDVAEAAETGLAAKLSKRDPDALRNSIFNKPPAAQVYPPFLRGEWEVTARFAGYLFPSKTVPRDEIQKNVSVPGFQKCSIAQFADVGRESTSYRMNISETSGLEDRAKNFASTIDAHLGYQAVKTVSSSNQNRFSIEFVKNRTRNAERIEIFCNARESELVASPNQSNLSIFVNSEYVRQVTFSLSQEFGVARQVVGNYAHYWTYRQQEGGDSWTGNVLTAVYLDPQDALYFKEPSKPIAVYSHQLSGKRVAVV